MHLIDMNLDLILFYRFYFVLLISFCFTELSIYLAVFLPLLNWAISAPVGIDEKRNKYARYFAELRQPFDELRAKTMKFEDLYEKDKVSKMSDKKIQFLILLTTAKIPS